jgi:hypothetical protein
VTATARAATRQPRERLSESRPSRRSGPLRRPRSFPTRRSHGVADNRSLNLLGATRTDRQKHVALIDADLRIADHCPDWPPRVPRLASRHAIPLLQVPASAAALVNPDQALSRHRSGRPRSAVPDRPAGANGQPRLRRPDQVIAGDGNGPGHCAHRSVAARLNPDQPQPCSGNTTGRHFRHSVGDCVPTGDLRLGARLAHGFVGRCGCGGQRAVRPGFGFGRYWVGRPAMRQRTSKPSSVPGQ